MPQFALLNIDGDRDKLMRRSRLLENAGLHTLNARSVPEAHELLRKHVATVMVVSAELAGESCPELCSLLKEQANPPRMLQISGSAASACDHARALENGADAYLHEPVSDAVLVATVRALTRFWVSLEQNRLEIERHRTNNENYQSMQHTLRFSEERRILAVEAADMGTWFYDSRSQELIWDARCYAVFGLEPVTPFYYNQFLECLHPDDRTRTDAAVQQAVATGSGYDIEYRVVHPTGEVRWVAAKGRASIGVDGRPERLQGIAIDITERKRVEERLQDLNQALKRSNLDLQEFAYAISHDLQEPLRMVNNFGRLIDKRYASDLPEEGREFFHFILDGAQRMDRMVRDLLNYSRVVNDDSTFEDVELRAALLWAMSNLEDTIQECGAEITYTELPTVKGDFVRLSQLFQNLLSNAMKYRGEDSPRIHVNAEPSPQHWVIAVNDNGVRYGPEFCKPSVRSFQATARIALSGHRRGTGYLQTYRRAAWRPHMG